VTSLFGIPQRLRLLRRELHSRSRRRQSSGIFDCTQASSADIAVTGLLPEDYIVTADNFIIEGLTFTAANTRHQDLGAAIDIAAYARNSLIKGCLFTKLGDIEMDTIVFNAIRLSYDGVDDELGALVHDIAIEDCIVEDSYFTSSAVSSSARPTSTLPSPEDYPVSIVSITRTVFNNNDYAGRFQGMLAFSDYAQASVTDSCFIDNIGFQFNCLRRKQHVRYHRG